MSVELRPFGVTCNIACQYCYQNPERDAGNFGRSYDLEAMKAAVLAEGGPFTLFGGEPLLIPLADLEHLWAWGLDRFGRNSIQTNGTLINAEHLRMFRQYKVDVGISLDGPGELNDVRWAGDLAKTRGMTARVEAVIELLCREGTPPSLILTLHRHNATTSRLPKMREWLLHLDRLGVRGARVHLLESEQPVIREKYGLSTGENIAALQYLAEVESELKTLRLDLFSEMQNLLIGRDRHASCVWMACDAYTTAAVRGVEGHGQRSNCGRTNKEGIDFVKSDRPGYERYLALYDTPQEDGGCQGCRFFLMCKGQCPGTAIDGDWRNRTEYCDVWKAVFGKLEEQLLRQGRTPLSLDPLRAEIEHRMCEVWIAGENPSIQMLLQGRREWAA